MDAINPDLLHDLRRGLETKIGKDNAITSQKICEALKNRGYNVNGATLRSHIHHLRTGEKMFICGDNSGYYVPKNEIEAENQIRSINSRIKELTEVAESLKASYRIKFSQIEIGF